MANLSQGPNSNMVSASQNGNNSTENLFNLIQATKTKNTMILEPLTKGQDIKSPRVEEIGTGLRDTGNPPRTENSQDLKSNNSIEMRNRYIIQSPSKA